MKIVVTFDSWEELESFRSPKEVIYTPVVDMPTPIADVLRPVVKATEDIKEKLTETLNADTVAAVKPRHITPPVAPEPEPVPEPVPEPDYELLRLDVRSILAELNKTHPGKPAQKMIASMGFKGLSEVPGERLQELMDRAKEAMNA